LEAAKRELLEETGLVAAKWEELLTMDLSNSVTDEVATIFIATDLEQRAPEPEPTEQLMTLKRPLSQVFDWVMQGEITDSITVAAVLKLKVLGYC
jgi:8-oxo-dGTP pyrophosphatase MutT (NUDIX family)